MPPLMRWSQFAGAAPELAKLGHDAFDQQHLCLVGTIRANGWPRISPNEFYFVEGDMLLGMMPGSLKARDLQRDPRITVVADGRRRGLPARLNEIVRRAKRRKLIAMFGKVKIDIDLDKSRRRPGYRMKRIEGNG